MASTSNAFAFLIQTLVHLYLVVILLRILLEAVRADFYNPVVQLLVRVTDPLVRPLSKLIPRVGRINVAAVVVLFLVQLIGLSLVLLVSGLTPDPLLLALLSLLELLRLLLNVYFVLIIVAVILSWLGHNIRHPIVPLVLQLTDPVLAPIRRVLPTLGGFDLSPLLALIGIRFLIILLGL